MRIALASPRIATSIDDGLEHVRQHMAEAASRGARIVCFPEAYVPGLRGLDFDVPDFTPRDLARVLSKAGEWAREYGIAAILGTEQFADSGRQIVSVVFNPRGEEIGRQPKVQLDPSEDGPYVPGTGRNVFEVDGLKFGIAICHEGWRYPETVRWAAVRGAKIVFHPYHAGSDKTGVRLTQWGDADAPYYEKAMMMRSIENAIYFASVNYGLRFQEAATSLIDPSGRCQAHLPYGQPGVLVEAIDPQKATGHLAMRFAPDRY
jgi:predicted amidohydrolase